MRKYNKAAQRSVRRSSFAVHKLPRVAMVTNRVITHRSCWLIFSPPRSRPRLQHVGGRRKKRHFKVSEKCQKLSVKSRDLSPDVTIDEKIRSMSSYLSKQKNVNDYFSMTVTSCGSCTKFPLCIYSSITSDHRIYERIDKQPPCNRTRQMFVFHKANFYILAA